VHCQPARVGASRKSRKNDNLDDPIPTRWQRRTPNNSCSRRTRHCFDGCTPIRELAVFHFFVAPSLPPETPRKMRLTPSPRAPQGACNPLHALYDFSLIVETSPLKCGLMCFYFNDLQLVQGLPFLIGKFVVNTVSEMNALQKTLYPRTRQFSPMGSIQLRQLIDSIAPRYWTRFGPCV
jgi:hypothetical protein